MAKKLVVGITQGDGNGIGLTIVGRLLVLCGGSIRVDSRPNMGSTFTVLLPVTVPAGGDTAKPTEE